MNQSEQINELASALAKAQAEIQPALKDSVNPFFKSKYADLSSVWNACKDPLSKNGLSVIQTMDGSSGSILLITTLAHSSGQWIRSSLPVNPTKNDPQGLGSALTYMRRYSLAAIVGVTTDEDDDGNLASQAPGKGAKSANLLPSMISRQQGDELQMALDSCDPEFVANVLAYIKNFGASTIYQLPVSKYEVIKKRIFERIHELENEEKVI